MDKQRIQASFGHAAADYDHYARIQKTAAQHLAERIAARWPQLTRILEIGCGTGNLTHPLLNAYPEALVHATDLAPDMLQACRASCTDAQRARMQFSQLDGEAAQGQGYDLVTSSLAFQWLDKPLAVCSRLRQQGARVAIATLVDGTFAEWKAAHHALGVSDGVLPFVGEGCVQRWAALHGAALHIETLTEFYPQAIDFVRAIKHIGAHTPREGHRPAPLAKVLRQFPDGITVSYRVAYLLADA